MVAERLSREWIPGVSGLFINMFPATRLQHKRRDLEVECIPADAWNGRQPLDSQVTTAPPAQSDKGAGIQTLR
jgi:hypothetical protein